MSIFIELAKAIRQPGQRVVFEVEASGADKIRAIITPQLGMLPAGATESEVRVFNLMARPIVIVGSPAEVEAALSDKLKSALAVQVEGESTIDLIRSIAEKAKQSAERPAELQDDDAGGPGDALDDSGDGPIAQPEQGQVAGGDIAKSIADKF